MKPNRLLLQHGLSLVELMIALVISLLIVIAASSFFLSSKGSRDTQEGASLLQDNARFATDIITRNIQQVGYQNYIAGTSGADNRREVAAASDGQPDIRGYNNSAAGSSLDNGVHNRGTNRVNNSDTLITRFQGSGVTTGDGSIIDCLGQPIPQPDSPGERAFSIFEVRQSSATAEPELRCKNSVSASSVQPIVRGVETLQIMYGVDTNNDSFVDRWLNAEEVNPGGDATAIVDWGKVRSVRVGMILRTPGRAGVAGAAATTLSPLGVSFSQNVNDTLSTGTDGRLRRVVTFTVNLRNQLQ